jgi:hypothetical protein
MALTIEVEKVGWGGASPEDVERLAYSVADVFAHAFSDRQRNVLISHTDLPFPFTTNQKSDLGQYVISLSTGGHFWSQYVYQLAHELCHVLAEPTTMQFDQFTWLEESICESASQFALLQLEKNWTTNPPYPNWAEFAVHHGEYYRNRVTDPAYALPQSMSFTNWLHTRLHDLENDRETSLRKDYTIVATQILGVFMQGRSTWEIVRYLHAAPRHPLHTLPDFLAIWANTCPLGVRGYVRSIASCLLD